MRKREVVWEDPRFRKKKAQPKPLKINKFGEAPCALPPAHVPQYATAAIPSGMTAPPRPRPAAQGMRTCPPQRATTSMRPTSAMARGPAAPAQKSPPTMTMWSTKPPPRAKPPVVVATRPPPLAPHGGARPKMMYRPGSALPQRPCPPSGAAQAPPPQRQMYSRPSTAAAEPCPPPRPPSPCLPSPPPCPSPGRRTPSPCAPPPQASARFSGLPRRSGLRPPTAGRSGLRPPSAIQSPATSVVARRQRSPEPCPPAPCPPSPCPPDPCPGESMSMMAPCPPPQVSTPQQRSQGSRLRPPSRLMAPGSFSGSRRSQQPKPQKIVLLPGDINPCETTVITVEPPEPDPCPRPRSPSASMSWNVQSVPFDFSPPSMDSFRREEACGIPSTPYIPPEVLSMVEEEPEPEYSCPESPSEMDMAYYDTSSALLIDVEPLDPCTMEPRVLIEPVDLITFPAPDPFSPERAMRPPSPSVSPPPHPFSPPKDPIPSPSELDKWMSQYPRYKEAFEKAPFHPVSEWAKLKYQKKLVEPDRQVQCVDRELVARSAPHNRNVSTICKDDDDDDDFDDELGLLHCMPDLDENFRAPLDYAAMRRQEEMEREERERRRRERERQERGPTLAETRELLARVREAESARRAEIARDVLSDYRPPAMSEEQMRRIHDRVIARHAAMHPQQQVQQQQQPPSDISFLESRACDFLEDVELDECDLDAIDYMDDTCID